MLLPIRTNVLAFGTQCAAAVRAFGTPTNRFTPRSGLTRNIAA